MEFIEPKINPNSTLKYALTEVERRPPKSEGNADKKTENSRNRAARGTQALHGSATSLAGRSCWVLGARSVRPIARPCLRPFCACRPLFCSALLPLIFGASSNLQSFLKSLVKYSFLSKSDDFS